MISTPDVIIITVVIAASLEGAAPTARQPTMGDLHQLPSPACPYNLEQYTEPERIYIGRVRGDAYVGNYVQYDQRHCRILMATSRATASTGIGRIVNINKESGTLSVKQYAAATQIPEECEQSLPIIQHTHLQHIPEVVELPDSIIIGPQCIVKFVFVIPAIEITNTNSFLHLQGMKDYYIIRFYYSNISKR